MLDFFSESLALQGGIMREGSTAGVPWVEREGRLFSVGVWKGRKYTSADLDKMATSFQPPADERTWSVPLQVDHSDSASDTVGSIRKVWRQGTDLLGTLRFYGQKAVDAVKTGLWQKLSVGIRPDMSLHHVAVVAHPALPGATFSDDWSGYSPAELRTAAAKLAAEVGLVIRNGEVHDPSKPLPTLADIQQEVAGAVKDGRIPGDLQDQVPTNWARARVVNMLKAAAKLERQGGNHSVEDEVAELMRARGREESPEDLVHSERRQVFEQLMAEDRANRPAEIVEGWVRAGLSHPSTASVEMRLVATYSEEQLRSYSELKQLSRPFYWVSQAEMDAEVHALQAERGHFTEGGRERMLTHGETPSLSQYSAEDRAEIDRLIGLSDKHPSSKGRRHEPRRARAGEALQDARLRDGGAHAPTGHPAGQGVAGLTTPGLCRHVQLCGQPQGFFCCQAGEQHPALQEVPDASLERAGLAQPPGPSPGADARTVDHKAADDLGKRDISLHSWEFCTDVSGPLRGSYQIRTLGPVECFGRPGYAFLAGL